MTKTHPSAILCTLGSSPGRYGVKPASDRLSYGTAKVNVKYAEIVMNACAKCALHVGYTFLLSSANTNAYFIFSQPHV